MRTEYVEAVLAVVELIPAGSAVAYGDVAELLGSGGPRQVGSVMSHYGSWCPVVARPEGQRAGAREDTNAKPCATTCRKARRCWGDYLD